MHSLIQGGLLLIIGYQMLLAGMHFRALALPGAFQSSGMKKLIVPSLEKSS